MSRVVPHEQSPSHSARASQENMSKRGQACDRCRSRKVSLRFVISIHRADCAKRSSAMAMCLPAATVPVPDWSVRSAPSCKETEKCVASPASLTHRLSPKKSSPDFDNFSRTKERRAEICEQRWPRRLDQISRLTSRQHDRRLRSGRPTQLMSSSIWAAW